MSKILIKNGRVWDGEKFAQLDVQVEDNLITAMAPQLPHEGGYLYDAQGKIVSAGLVDTHLHMRVTGKEPYGYPIEMSCLPFGVTAAADAGRWQGSTEVMDSFVVKNVVFVSALVRNNHAITEKMAPIVDYYGHRVVGIKIFYDTTTSDMKDLTPLQEVCDFAHSRGLKVMVHCSHSPVSMAQVLSALDKGDILTHAFHGAENNAAEDNYESMIAAQKRGVIIDGGFAATAHMDLGVFRGAVAKGLIPNTISTDITNFSAYTRGGRYGMTMCMSIAREAGMREEDIFRAVTSNAAKALGKDGWGELKVGGPADIAVLEYAEEPFSLKDRENHSMESQMGYRCLMTIANGQILYKH